MQHFELTMQSTPARKQFKRSFGSANQFMITLIVGLESVRQGVATPPTNFDVAWDPIDMSRAADRSQDFAHQAALVFLAAGLDEYLKTASKYLSKSHPSLHGELYPQRKGQRSGFDHRIDSLARHAGMDDSLEVPLVRVAVQWRSRVAHPAKSPALRKSLASALRARKLAFAEQYRHLDVEQLISNYESSGVTPSFKELAGMIRAVHIYVRTVDEWVIRHIDYDSYFEDVLRAHLAARLRADSADIANRVWGRTPSRARTTLVNLAMQSGFAPASKDSQHGLKAETLDELSQLSVFSALHSYWVLGDTRDDTEIDNYAD